VAGDVGQRLGDNAVGRQFDRSGQRRQFTRRHAGRQQTAVRAPVKPLGVPAQRLDQPQLIERRGPQLMDQVPDVSDRVTDRLPDLRAEHTDLIRIRRCQVDGQAIQRGRGMAIPICPAITANAGINVPPDKRAGTCPCHCTGPAALRFSLPPLPP
jgi:hypothetical protein